MKDNSTASDFLFVAEADQLNRRSAELSRLWLFACVPLVIACGLFFSLLLSTGFLLKFGTGFEATRDALVFLLLISLPALAAAIEVDFRLRQMRGAGAESARGLLGFASFLAFGLFLVWTAEAMAHSSSHEAGIEFLLCVLIVGICGPLLWSAARQVARTEHRLALLGGFVVATLALELGFDETAPDAEERFFLYQSLLIALAVTVRLGVWGLKEFHRPPASPLES